MEKKPLIGASIFAMVLLVLSSLSNVVGYQSVESSHSYPIVEQNQVNNQLEQKKVTRYSDSECNCGRDSGVAVRDFPIICTIISLFANFIIALFPFPVPLWNLHALSEIFNCPDFP